MAVLSGVANKNYQKFYIRRLDSKMLEERMEEAESCLIYGKRVKAESHSRENSRSANRDRLRRYLTILYARRKSTKSRRRRRWRVWEEGGWEKGKGGEKAGASSCAEKLREIARKNRLFRRVGIYVYTYMRYSFTSVKFYGILCDAYYIEFVHVSIRDWRKCNSLYAMAWLKIWLKSFAASRLFRANVMIHSNGIT